jgi:hypothetical protein
MELSPSWEAASRSATQEIPKILWNPKFHYLVNKSPTLVPTQRQINPVYTTSSYLSTIRFKFSEVYVHKWCISSLPSFLKPLVTSSLLGPNILLNDLLLKHPQSMLFP